MGVARSTNGYCGEMVDGVGKMKGEKFWERELFMYFSQYYCWARTCLHAEKELIFQLLWQAYCGLVDFESVCVLFREGTHGLAV